MRRLPAPRWCVKLPVSGIWWVCRLGGEGVQWLEGGQGFTTRSRSIRTGLRKRSNSWSHPRRRPIRPENQAIKKNHHFRLTSAISLPYVEGCLQQGFRNFFESGNKKLPPHTEIIVQKNSLQKVVLFTQIWSIFIKRIHFELTKKDTLQFQSRGIESKSIQLPTINSYK